MAKKKQDEFNEKEVNKFLGDFMFEEPDKLDDGTIKTPRYKTGIVMFDLLTNGGLPQGRIVGIGAEKGAGKTTMLIQICGYIVETYGKKAYYLDVEGGASYELFNDMGYADLLYNPKTNPEGKLFLLAPETIQQIAAIIKKVAEDPDTAIIVIDSDTSVVDQVALDDDELGTANKAVGSDARMWSKASKPFIATIKRSKACLVIVHQARVDLSGFMPKIVSTGGNAAKHMASVEIWGKRKSWIADDFTLVSDKRKAVGAYVSLSTEKNRLTKPFASVMIPIFFGRGVSNKWAYKEWLETHTWVDDVTAEVKPFINKKGAWYEISLPSGLNEKVQGDKAVWAIVNDNYDYIRDYVDSHGGFSVSSADDDDGSDNPFDE